MEALADEIARRPSNFPPRLIVGITWAYSSAGFRPTDLFHALAKECLSNCDALENKEVASLAWSFASIGCFHRPLLAALADSSRGRWRDFDPPSLAQVAWACATAREDRPRLFEEIASAAARRSGDFAAQSASMLLWACAAVGHVDRHLFETFAPRVATLLGDCNSQALANIAWAYTVADVDAESLFGDNSSFITALVEKAEDFDFQGLGQLHQWNLWRKERMTTDGVLPPALEILCYEKFTNQAIHDSHLQNDIISELDGLGLAPNKEYRTKSGYCLDALLNVNGMLVGMEVDGPTHFVGRNPAGSTILKHRQVANIDDIEIVSLPYWELNHLVSPDQKHQYLKEKLDIATSATG